MTSYAAALRCSQAYHHLEPAPEHALAVEGHFLGIHHRREALVLHHLAHHAVAMLAVLVDDPGKPDHLVLLQLDALREGRVLARLDVVRDALPVLERAVLAADLSHLPCDAHVGLLVPFRHRQYETLYVSHDFSFSN